MVISLRVSHLSDLFYSQDIVQGLLKWLSSLKKKKKNPPAFAGDSGSFPELESSPGGRNGNLL